MNWKTLVICFALALSAGCATEEFGEADVDPESVQCDSNYEGACVPNVDYDLDCDDVDGEDFEVVGDDPHGFDEDSDGRACEPYDGE